jgi:hypothetical protein
MRSAPVRLLLLHSIELYLNALLHNAGVEHEPNHKLHDRYKLATQQGLKLHATMGVLLKEIQKHEEYRVVRYTPITPKLATKPKLSELDQLEKILRQIQSSLPKELRAPSLNRSS